MPKKLDLDLKIAELKTDYINFRTMCVFKIQEKKDQFYRVDKKCLMCNGYSTVNECEDYIDVLHLINFYERYYENKPKFDKEGYYK